MESEDLINLPASSNSGNESENNDVPSADCERGAADSLPNNSEIKENQLNGDFPGNEDDIGNKSIQSLLVPESDKDLIDNTTIVQVTVELGEAVEVQEKMNCFNSAVHTENGSVTVQDGSLLGNLKRDGSSISSQEKDISSISGIKRPRVAIDEQPPSVLVSYNSLPRDSKRKLEKLLQQWSEWHARHYASSVDSNQVLESGEETYFPALHVGVDTPSSVTFWMDSQTRDPQSKEVIMLDSNSVPLYDRGYTFGLTQTDGSGNVERGMEIVDASRCFNCGSYNHSLKECPKPRDNITVSNARKEQKTRRNQNASSRNPTRYYQSTPGGKYDGLKPGVLDVETRKLLGLGELDPPPWLNRMREIGYPPGYLDPEDEDQPSGITIFAEEERKEEKEDGEILDTDNPELPRKMSVEFPGINAPVPENADEKRWIAGHSSVDLSRNRSNRRFNHLSEPSGRYYQEQRWPRDIRDDGPPGVDPVTNPAVSSYPPRYGGYDSTHTSYSPRGNDSILRSPSFERSLSDRGRRSPLLVHETSKYGSYGTSMDSPANRLPSQQNYGSASSENGDNGRWNEYTPDSSFHRKDKHNQHHHHSRR